VNRLKRAIFAYLVLPIIVARGVGAEAAPVADYEVKAELVERFTRFVEWPAGASSPDKPFEVCGIGDSPIESYLRALVATRKIKDRPAELRRVWSMDEIDGCQVLVIAPSERDRLGRIIARTSNQPILTVGDGEGFAERGALISFRSEPPLTKFDVNLGAAKASGLQFSSQLLRVARIVGGAK
jgi:hypothetical protein